MEYLDKGIELFNDEKFRDAHEMWEGEWRNAGESPEKHFLQGMIMIAAALYHCTRKEYAGTRRLLEKGKQVLEMYREAHIDIDRENFIQATALFHECFKAHEQETSDKEFPRIRRLPDQKSGEGGR